VKTQPRLWSMPVLTMSQDIVPLLGGIVHGAPPLPSRSCALQLKTQVPALDGTGDDGGLVASLLGAVSWIALPLLGCGGLLCSVVMPMGLADVEAAALNRMWRARAVALEGSAVSSLWCKDAACRSLGSDLGHGGGRVVGSVNAS
jgi:hypothetical protein